MLSDIRKKNKHSTGSEVLDWLCVFVFGFYVLLY